VQAFRPKAAGKSFFSVPGASNPVIETLRGDYSPGRGGMSLKVLKTPSRGDTPMTKYDWTDYFAWLDRASIGGLIAARDKAYETRRMIKDPDYRSDLRRMIRLMDEELLTRADLAYLAKRRASASRGG
jgi:hypothetical protein